MQFLSSLKQIDVYRKPMEDFRIRTYSGGCLTLAAAVLMLFLSTLETMNYLTTNISEHLFVDSTTSDIKVDISFDITFQKLPCAFVTVDVMDASGGAQDDIKTDIFKIRLDNLGANISEVVQKIGVNQVGGKIETTTIVASCGSCYGALPDGECCNTCEEVKQAYALKGWQVNIEEVVQCKNDDWIKNLHEMEGEGCRIYGKVQVAKVAGNFHLAPGESHQSSKSHVHDIHSIQPARFDASHTINHLSFGRHFPGKQFPLDGRDFSSENGGVMFVYNAKVVPTSYHYTNGNSDTSYQFSITRQKREIVEGSSGLPGVFFQYEFSPLMVKYEEQMKSISAFLVSLCAIIGGIFALAQLIDIALYKVGTAIKTN